jgi:hypothetical protein
VPQFHYSAVGLVVVAMILIAVALTVPAPATATAALVAVRSPTANHRPNRSFIIPMA